MMNPQVKVEHEDTIILHFNQSVFDPFDIAVYNFAKIKIVVDPLVYVRMNDSNPQCLNRSISCSIGQRASLLLVHDQDCKLEASQSLAFDFTLAQDARLVFVGVNTQPHDTRYKISVHINGQDASASLKFIYALNGNQRISFDTLQSHNAPRTLSRMRVFGVLNGQSQSDYHGNICIAQNAKQSDALQENKTLLLDKRARAQATPTLQVLTNDVSCKHGAASGFLNPLHLFYLQSRGLAVPQAKQLLIKGFLQNLEILEKPVLSDVYRRIERQTL